MHSPGQAIADIKRMLAERQVLASPAATPFLSLSPFREREDRPASAGSNISPSQRMMTGSLTCRRMRL
jgi:hypothetical protein